MDRTEFQCRLDACLDARRDPLDDAELVAFLDAHPEVLSAFASQRDDLRGLQALPTPVPQTGSSEFGFGDRVGRRWLLPTAAIATAAAAVLAWSMLHEPGTSGAEQNSTRPPRILAASLEEVPELLRVAGSYTLRQSLVRSATVTFEAYESHSQMR